MKTILVDDELWAMRQFESECASIEVIELVGCFDSCQSALRYARENPVEFALLDIEMPGMNGIELAKKLRDLYPAIIIIFVTAHQEYLIDFIHVKADYYVLKPYTKEDVESTLQRAKLLSKRLDKSIFFKTFGNFEMFIEGKPTDIRSAKARELLALLVEKRGGKLDAKEAFMKMWEGREYNNKNASVYRKTLSTLQEILSELGIQNILITLPHGRAVNTELFDCDLYAFLDGDEETIKNFPGIYMSEYSWGELMLAVLTEKKYGFKSFANES